jgi:hypothetical protein
MIPRFIFSNRSVPRRVFPVRLSDQSEFVGGVARFEVLAVGYPAPVTDGAERLWSANQYDAPDFQSPALRRLYQLSVSNASGVITSAATLTVRAKPDLDH